VVVVGAGVVVVSTTKYDVFKNIFVLNKSLEDDDDKANLSSMAM